MSKNPKFGVQYGEPTSEYTNPVNLFRGPVASIAPLFAENRFNWQSPQGGRESFINYIGPQKISGEPSYDPNMAAIEIYNTKNPLGDYLRKKGQSNKFFAGDKSNYGHSEPRIMRQLLDELIPRNFKEAGIQRPSDTSRAPKSHDREYEILSQLVQNPVPYKEYLEGTNKRINAISELPFCTTNGGCSQFMRDISPEGSKLKHILPEGDWGDRRPYQGKVQEVMEGQVKPAYKDYMDYEYQRKIAEDQQRLQKLLNSPAQRDFTQSRSRTASPEESLHSPNYFPRTPMSSYESSSIFSSPNSEEYWNDLRGTPMTYNRSMTQPGQIVSPYQSSSSSSSGQGQYSPPSRSDLDMIKRTLF